jgi:hypothetical protein
MWGWSIWTRSACLTFRVEYTEDLTNWFPIITALPSVGLSTAYLTPAAPWHHPPLLAHPAGVK